MARDAGLPARAASCATGGLCGSIIFWASGKGVGAKLDRIDIRVLHELQRNGRIANVELVHLSPSPCLMQVEKLQKAGYITGYSAGVDVAKLGPTLTVLAEVTLCNQRRIDFARFQEVAERAEEIVECP